MIVWVIKRADLLPCIYRKFGGRSGEPRYIGGVVGLARVGRGELCDGPVDSRERRRGREMIRFDGKIALVTGGYGVIGSAVSRGLANFGAKVAVAGHKAAKANSCAEAIGGYA